MMNKKSNATLQKTVKEIVSKAIQRKPFPLVGKDAKLLLSIATSSPCDVILPGIDLF